MDIEIGKIRQSKVLSEPCSINEQREIRRLRKSKVSFHMIAVLQGRTIEDVKKMCVGIGHAEGRIDGGSVVA